MIPIAIHMNMIPIPVNIIHIKHPVGQSQPKQWIKLDIASYRTQIMKIHVHIQHAYIVIFKKIIKRGLDTHRIGYIILILDSQSDTFNFCTITKTETYGLFPFLRISTLFL